MMYVLMNAGSIQAQGVNSYGPLNTRWYRTGWFVEANAGVRLLGVTSDYSDMGAGLAVNSGIGYMLENNIIGIRGRVHYLTFQNTSLYSDTKSLGLSVDVMADMVSLIKKRPSNTFRFYAYAGLGISTVYNKEWTDYRNTNNVQLNDPFLKGQDDIADVSIGITPQYHINGRLSVNLEVNTYLRIKQDHPYDMSNPADVKGLNGVMTLAAGLTFRP